MSKPLILICNDDGIASPGIHRLVDYVTSFGEIYVVAPDQACSGKSSAMTVNSPLRITQHEDYNGARMFSVSGTPVDCVKLSIHHIVPRKPDLMLSGINHGSNAGNSVIYSGTMGAAFEACMIGIPAVGYSLLSHSMTADFTPCREMIQKITNAVIENSLPEGVCLNVNFPVREKIEGMKTVRSAHSHWTEEYREYQDPHGKNFYWLTGKIVNEEPENPDTDLYWLDKGFATIVPCTPDQNAVSSIETVKKILL